MAVLQCFWLLLPSDPVEIAKIIEDSGAAAVAVHGRTRQQYYAGEADWDTIRRIKEAVSIPVIGNGDVDSPKKAEALVRETGCDGIMIGRAVRGNPWIFREMNHYFTTGELLPRPSWEEIREMILRHARMQIELKGEFTGIIAVYITSQNIIPQNGQTYSRIFTISVLYPNLYTLSRTKKAGIPRLTANSQLL